MIRRNRRGRFTKQRVASRWERIMLLSVLGGILLGVSIDYVMNKESHYVYAKEVVEEVVVEPQVVQLVVRIDWTEDRIIEEIRKVFYETPNTAVAIAKCESGLKPEIQSQHVLSYGQEESFGIFQIHKRDWHQVALRLGYDEYQTDVQDNLAMARFIYENAGNSWKDWSCYKQGLYKKYL